MKYKEILTIFLTIIFILTLAFFIAVDSSIWYIPLILFLVLVYMFYKLWIEK